MELKIKAAKTRAVSARELSRRMANLLDEIETEGSGLVVLRYGRPAALLVPLEPKVHRAPRRVVIEELQDERFEMPALCDDARHLLLEMADRAPDPYNPEDWTGPIGEFCSAFVSLELEGLVERDGGGRWLTAQGERVAAALSPRPGPAPRCHPASSS